MTNYFGALASQLEKICEDVTGDLTMVVQTHAEKSGWPIDAWRSLNVEYQKNPDENGFQGYKIMYWRAAGDIDAVREREYGFGATSEPNPAMRRMATRLPGLANYLIDRKLRGA